MWSVYVFCERYQKRRKVVNREKYRKKNTMGLLCGLLAFSVLLESQYLLVDASLPAGTTAWPEICRVMSLYRDCNDQTYRIACGRTTCTVECIGSGLVYVPSTGSCYGAPSDGLNTWPFAQDSCKAYGGRLMTVKDQSDADVVQYLVEQSGTSYSDILVGGLNIGKDDIWINLDGTQSDNTFWASGSAPTSSENLCLASLKNSAYKLGSDNCKTNNPFICEGSYNVL